MLTIEDVPIYYRETDTFKDYFIDGEITFEEFKESKLFGFIRDDSPIVDNEDFLFTLKSLDYYLVEILPDFVIDYIKKNPQPIKTDYVYKDLWNKQIISKLNLINLFNCEDRELINEFILNSNSKFSLGMLHLALIDENGYINVLSVKNLQDNKCSIIPGGKFIAVSSGLYHTSAIRQDGTIETWGDNTYQQCNNIPSGKFIFISSGPYHTSGIREDGTVVTWGCNKYKQYNKLPKGRFLSISSGILTPVIGFLTTLSMYICLSIIPKSSLPKLNITILLFCVLVVLFEFVILVFVLAILLFATLLCHGFILSGPAI